ncbi:HpcH/HpaI aldolase family protein [Brevirhabdus sp.]|uniref:HpcH/HpaI aldolase family protein n=1 Tax=Brevirhabdus sp. TaxID=2004514 RepID=UPI0040597514
MRKNTVLETCRAGGTAVNAWLGIPHSVPAEIMGHQGFDSVTVDLQHGMIGFQAAVSLFQVLSSTPALPFARVSRNDPALIMQLLDAGAYGIICPMISTPAQARQFVDACRYPPLGGRSFGPSRGPIYGGPDYFDHANDEILTLAMIETAEGLENLETILATEGLNGIFIGPNDLCLALGVRPRSEPEETVVVQAIARILGACRETGKIAGIYCSSGQAAAMRADQGFHLVTPGNDCATLTAAARAQVDAVVNRGRRPDDPLPAARADGY